METHFSESACLPSPISMAVSHRNYLLQFEESINITVRRVVTTRSVPSRLAYECKNNTIIQYNTILCCHIRTRKQYYGLKTNQTQIQHDVNSPYSTPSGLDHSSHTKEILQHKTRNQGVRGHHTLYHSHNKRYNTFYRPHLNEDRG